jgi:hypothetical protein
MKSKYFVLPIEIRPWWRKLWDGLKRLVGIADSIPINKSPPHPTEPPPKPWNYESKKKKKC